MKTVWLSVIALFMILVTLFFSGCGGDDEEDEFVNPKSTTIGPQGGTALSADGNAIVEIPAGAVSSDTAIIVGEPTGSPPRTVGKAYKFGPKDFQFSKPVTISLKYDSKAVPAGADDSDLVLARESANQWEEVSSCVVDSQQHTVTGSVMGFSIYSIIWPDQPETSAEYWNLVNNQVCKVLDAIREVNRGQLLMMRGLEDDFTHEFDPNGTEFSDWQTNCILGGYMQIAGSLDVLEEALQELAELEIAAERNMAPSAWGIGDVADAINGVAWDLCQNSMIFVKSWLESSEEYRQKMKNFVGKAIENKNLTPTDCDLVCCLNTRFDIELDDPFSSSKGDAICEENEAELREEAFQIINYLDNKELHMLGGSFKQCSAHDLDNLWKKALNDQIMDTGVRAYKDGMKGCWDATQKIAPMGKAGDVMNHLGTVFSASGALAPAKNRAPKSDYVVQPADVVIFLVPYDTQNLPVVAMAAVPDENGLINIPEPCVGSHRIFCYSRGNYPVIMDNVDISPANPQIVIPAPRPLENVANPLFPALTAGDPTADIEPPVMSSCPGCQGGYSVVHEVHITGESWGDLGTSTSEYSTKVEFTFDWNEDWEAFVEVPYVINISYSPWVSVDGQTTVTKSPSSFALKGIAEWHLMKRMHNDKAWYYAYVSTIDDEIQTYTSTTCEAGECVSFQQEIKTWTWTGNFFPSKLGSGDMPIIYEEHTVELHEELGNKRTSDITITIEENN